MTKLTWKDSNWQKPEPLSFIVALDKKTKESYIWYSGYLEWRHQMSEYFWIELPTLPTN